MKRIIKVFLLSTLSCFALFVVTACNGKVGYKLNFMVDGEIYSTISATNVEKIELPNDPLKAGYTFDGWFFDDGIWKKAFTEDSLVDVKISTDINVYAKWKIKKATDEPHTQDDEFLLMREDGIFYGKVSKDTERYDFDGKISYDGNYVVYREPLMDPLENNIATLETGDNRFYVYFDNGKSATAVVRRRPVYRVEFRSEDGFVLITETEEDVKATEPRPMTRDGYTFSGWSRDLDIPITEQTVINAIWTPNTDTPYRIEYYLRNLENNDFTLTDTEYLTGTTGENVTVDREFDHFSIMEPSRYGRILFDGVIKVYYERDVYLINVTSSGNVSIDRPCYRLYKYGYRIDEITATFNDIAGYNWVGWTENGELLTAEKVLPAFNVERSVNIIAKTEIDPEFNTDMLPFTYVVDGLSCTVTGLKDKTMTEITIPDYVTEIGMWAFGNCADLERVTIGNGVRRINGSAFYGCEKLESVTLGNNVEIISGSVFQGCSNLTEISIPKTVDLIGDRAFSYCDSLISINVAEDNADYKSIDGNLYDKSGRVLMQYAIGKTATEFTVPDAVTEINSSAFAGCSRVTDITIGGNVEKIKEYAFNCCTNLVRIDIPDSVKTIGNQAFSWCENLESVTIGSGTEFIFSSFLDCQKLIEINVSEENAYYKSIDGILYDKSGETLVQYAEGKTATSFTVPDGVTTIGAGAFSLSKNLKIVNIPKGVTSIGQSAFWNCTGLTEIIIPDSVLTIYSWAFSGCENLENVTLGNGISDIDYGAFNGCLKLREIIIPSSVYRIGNSAFNNCNGLTEIIIPDNVLSVGNLAFYSCDNLESITIGKGLTTLEDQAFFCCDRLKEIIVSEENAAFKSVNGNLYDKTGKVLLQYAAGKTATSFTVPNGVEIISELAFSGCACLTEIAIPSGVAEIGDRAFKDCSSLTAITIPKSVETIWNDALEGCGNLTEIHYEGTKAEWVEKSKGDKWMRRAPSDFTVICLDGDIVYTRLMP